jgi:hypothetical protein
MIYVSYGVPKSASTFTYVLTEQVLRSAGRSPIALSETIKNGKTLFNYIDKITWNAVQDVMTEVGGKSAVIKTHGVPDAALLEAIDRGEVFASAVLRDPRDIALALLDHGNRSRAAGIRDFAQLKSVADTFKFLEHQFQRLAAWMQTGKVLLLTYEEVCFHTESAVRRIADQLGVSVEPASVLAALPDKGKIKQFNKGIQRRYEQEMSADTQQLFLDRFADVYRVYLDPARERERTNSHPDEARVADDLQALAAASIAQAPDFAESASAKSVPAEQLVRALYRVVLFREPDSAGLRSYVEAMNTGRSVEDTIRRFLESREFASKRGRFLKTYASTDRSGEQEAESAKTAPASIDSTKRASAKPSRNKDAKVPVRVPRATH